MERSTKYKALKQSILVKRYLLTCSFICWCQIISWLNFKTCPSFLSDFGMARLFLPHLFRLSWEDSRVGKHFLHCICCHKEHRMFKRSSINKFWNPSCCWFKWLQIHFMQPYPRFVVKCSKIPVREREREREVIPSTKHTVVSDENYIGIQEYITSDGG